MQWSASCTSVRPWLLLAVVALCSCSSGPAIRSHVDSSADFSKFRTYAFYEAPASGGDSYSSFLVQYLRNAIDRELQARGYERALEPDVLVNFHLNAQEKVQISQTPTPAGYYGWRRGYAWGGPAFQTDVSTYSEGTLNIDVVDRARNELAWEGVAVGRIKRQSLENPQPAINAVVAQIFESYPARAGQRSP